MQSHVSQPCLLCAAGSRAGLLCPACATDLPALAASRCPICAQPTPDHAICGACLRHPPAFDSSVAALAYAFPLDILIQRLKFGGELAVAHYLAHRLRAALPHTPPVDLLIPMPLHPRRLAERGFNQAVEIARPLARDLRLPLAIETCRRVRHAPPQTGLDWTARRRNLRGAFHCDADLKGKRVALLDDVMTTGASLHELARAAKAAGALEVTAWVVARATRAQ